MYTSFDKGRVAAKDFRMRQWIFSLAMINEPTLINREILGRDNKDLFIQRKGAFIVILTAYSFDVNLT